MRRKPWIYAIGALVLGSLGLGAWVAAGMAEPRDMRADGWGVYLFVPSKLRQAAFGTTCAPATFSKSFIECGGICGEIYTVQMGQDTSDAEAALERLRALAGQEGYWDEVLALDTGTASDAACPNRTLRFIYNYKDAKVE